MPVTGSVDTRSDKGPELRVLKCAECFCKKMVNCLFTTTLTLVENCGPEGCSAAEKFLEKLEALATSLELEPASRAYRSLVLVSLSGSQCCNVAYHFFVTISRF